MHKKLKGIFIIVLVIVLIFGIVKIVNMPNVKQLILKKMYPMTYSEYVYKYSEENDINPLLIFAIIKAESNFNAEVVSSSNAMGLMQLMESTAEEIMQKDLQENFSKDMLFNPEDNIKIGTTYFAKLLNRYNGNIPIALTAYNAGIGKVDRLDKRRYYKRRWFRY